MRIHGIFGEWYDAVEIDGVPLDPAESLEVFNHSPNGFAWGYYGSGPAQLALAILLAADVPEETAVRLHQTFKEQFIGGLPQGDDFVLEIDVPGWVQAQLHAVSLSGLTAEELFEP